MLEPYTNNVYIESPPSEDLPRFDRTYIPSSDAAPKIPRHIYLRPGDTVHFEDESCAIFISAGKSNHSTTTSFAEGASFTAGTEIQVKSSAHQPVATGPGAVHPEDEDDLDGQINTPLGGDDLTPATSRPTDGLAVKDTPSRPFSRESNPIFSTAPDGLRSPNFIGESNGADVSTPAAHAGAVKGKRAKVNSSDDVDSQFVFPNTKGQTTYGGTPKPKPQTKKEILESPTKSELLSDEATVKVAPEPRRSSHRTKVDEDAAVTMSSPNRKRSLAGTDDEKDGVPPASTAPPTKKPRARPAKEPKTVKTPQAKTGKSRARLSKGSKVEEDEHETAEPPSSSGKLKSLRRKTAAKLEADEEDDEETVSVVVPRRNANLSPDLDPRASATPQSSATNLSGTPPTKVLLSKSRFADDKKAANWLRKHGASIEDKKIPGKRVNFVCIVGSGELATTAKVVRSVALGKRVVTDEWLKDCMEQDRFLDLDSYVHDDLADTMHISRSKLFDGKALFVTSALEKTYGQGFADIKELAAAVGSLRVESGAAKKASGLSGSATIFLADDGDDQDALKLMQEEGRAVYQKNLLTQSIIRGELLINDDEFKWNPKPVKGKKGKK